MPGRDLGSHFAASTRTRALIRFSNSAGGKAGREMRVAEVSIRAQFREGRKSRRRPSWPR